jgi:hypothetical protein
MDKYYKLDEDTITFFNNVFSKKAFPVKIDFEFIGNSKQKSFIKIAKIADQYEFLLEKQLIISVNEELFDAFDDESKTILFEQEIDKLTIDVDKGKIKMIKPDLNTFSGLISKYGIEKISRANSVEITAVQQKEDMESDFV